MWKPVGKLTVADLLETPVWECRYESDVELVRPTGLRELHEYQDGPVHLVLTTFTLGNGQLRHGYCSPADSSGIDYTQPVIITPSGRVPLWQEAKTPGEDLEHFALWLGVDSSQMLPINVESRVPVDGSFYRDIVHAI
jgi:hypothetical protein